jgi:hypothetical protein
MMIRHQTAQSSGVAKIRLPVHAINHCIYPQRLTADTQ